MQRQGSKLKILVVNNVFRPTEQFFQRVIGNHVNYFKLQIIRYCINFSKGNTV